MRLVQFRSSDGERRVGRIEGGGPVEVLRGAQSVYDLALAAARGARPLAGLVAEIAAEDRVDLDELAQSDRMLPPLDHPDPAHCLVTGTGLTHIGSAQAPMRCTRCKPPTRRRFRIR